MKRNSRKMAEINLLSEELYKAIELNQLDEVRDIIRRADLIESDVLASVQFILTLTKEKFLGDSGSIMSTGCGCS
jgi:hypothetical protein